MKDGLIFRMLYGLLGYYMGKQKLVSKFELNSRRLSLDCLQSAFSLKIRLVLISSSAFLAARVLRFRVQ